MDNMWVIDKEIIVHLPNELYLSHWQEEHKES